MKPGKDYPGLSVAFWCIDRDGRLLWQLRSRSKSNHPGTWDVGAGKVNTGEALETALRREVFEEYGIEPDKYTTLALGHREDLAFGHHWVCFDFAVLLEDDDVTIVGDPDEIDALQKVPIGGFPTGKIHPGAEKGIRLYRGRLIEIVADWGEN